MNNHARPKPVLVLYPVAEIFNALQSEIAEAGNAPDESLEQAIQIVSEWQRQGIRLLKTRVEIAQNPLDEDSQNTSLSQQVIQKRLQPEILYDVLTF